MRRIGLISDTHGLLRPEAVRALHGCDFIVHAGDIVGARILDDLSLLAPVTAVRGNNDKGDWARALPETGMLRVEDVSIYVIHDLHDLDIDPQSAGVQVVVSGHSHTPVIDRRGEVLFVNPGSAGPRRFRLPITLAELVVDGASVQARILALEPAPTP
ncbi:metallophosphoesterase family protein [Piscinibacter terrae]|uniref:Phosphoesterase n=1 Tax=Piscinibacter terrae TaxID=2496871 RepID=A0A3N7HSR6_9BURK|nr:metallophosphoesterase [Albitalea terrae]RQP25337.1 metallophosphoesterase [Albitalea terrae]